MEVVIGSPSQDWPQIVTALAALMAAFFGPVAGYLAAKHQAKRGTVSVNRQKWIDELRSEIATFIVECSGVGLEADPQNPLRGGNTRELMKAHFAQIDRLLSMIELRLNPNEADHQDLLAKLRGCVAASIKGEGYGEAKEAALKSAKVVLKREWEVVKSGG